MSSRIRQSLVLTTLLALVLALAGVAARSSLAANPPNTTIAGIDVDATTIPQLEQLMNSHRLNAVDLMNFYLRRIRQLNPTLHAVITVSPTARADARAADQARRDGDHGPLLGMPIIVKDNIDTTGMPTTAGSWALAGSTPDDAFIVQRLKAAGAIIIGKANLSEWANFRSGPSSRQPVRLELRLGRLRGCRSRGRSRRHRDGRLDRLPVRRQRRRRDQAHTRALEPQRRRPDQRQPGHGRPDCAQRHRCCRPARRSDRCRPARHRDLRASRSRLHRLHPLPQ